MSSEALQILALALLPALGNFGAGMLAEWLDVSRRSLNMALHATAGIVIAVVAVELRRSSSGRKDWSWARSGAT